MSPETARSAASTPTTSPTTVRPLWIFPETGDAEAAENLALELRLPIPLARLLLRRGYPDPAAALAFLNPRIEDLHDPFLLRDMDRAVERIRAAISGREKIEIHGDYDVDGVTSTVVLKKALELAGAGSKGAMTRHSSSFKSLP